MCLYKGGSTARQPIVTGVSSSLYFSWYIVAWSSMGSSSNLFQIVLYRQDFVVAGHNRDCPWPKNHGECSASHCDDRDVTDRPGLAYSFVETAGTRKRASLIRAKGALPAGDRSRRNRQRVQLRRVRMAHAPGSRPDIRSTGFSWRSADQISALRRARNRGLMALTAPVTAFLSLKGDTRWKPEALNLNH